MQNSSHGEPLMSSFTGEKQLAFFPLSLFLLPEGVSRLRIFEPRYVALVSDACKRGGFVVLLKQQQVQLPQSNELASSPVLGCWLDIVDFSGDDSNILFIDIKCRALVNINSIVTTANPFDDVCVSYKNFWQLPEHNRAEHNQQLAQSLQGLFNQHPNLGELYHGQVLEEPTWLCARWLELLPIDLAQKNKLLAPNSFPMVEKLVYQLLFGG